MADHLKEIEETIRRRFARLAEAPEEEQLFPTGPDSAERLGYPAHEVHSLPASVTESFAGVGNPFIPGWPREGEVVLDVGCGAGMDALLAARRVGSKGKVIGVDFVTEMIARAEWNAAAVGASNVHFMPGRADELPLEGGSVDMVFTNGVFNLCTDKPAVVSEMYRVLRPGGRLQMADILLEAHVTPEELIGKGTWDG